MRNLIYIFLVLLIFTGCKDEKSLSKQIKVSSPKDDKLLSKPLIQKDIYINKEFFAGDELNDVEIITTEKTGIDSLTYSIYKIINTDHYIFALEKFLKNDDVEMYRITDTLNLKSSELIIDLVNEKKAKILYLKSNQTVLKKWVFNQQNVSEKADLWEGNFSSNFLRMKEESGDPRSKGIINIQIQKNSANFQLDSYVENIKKELVIVSEKDNEIVLSEKNNKNSTFVMTKDNKKYFLKSNFINKTVGENNTYELVKR